MKRSLSNVFLAATLLLAPHTAGGQGGYGRGGSMGQVRYGPSAPKLPGVELTGPLDSALARVTLALTPDQAKRYAQVYDSFMVATRPQRDSAQDALAKMNERLDGGDRAAAMLYIEQLQDLGKYLKDRQDRFESDLRRFLNGDQVKAYKKWREGEDQAAERKRRQDEVRWEEAGFRGQLAAGGGVTPEIKTALPSPSGVADPALGSQSVRVGRNLYITGQLGVDSSGTLVGSDIRAAGRSFSPGPLALGRLALGSVLLGALVLSRPTVRPTRRELALLVLAGVLWFGVYQVVLNEAERRVDAGTAAMLVLIAPIFIVALAAVFLQERTTPNLLLGGALAFGGVVVIGLATSSGSASLVGVMLCLLAALSSAVGMVAEKPVLHRITALQATWTCCAVGALFCLPYAPQLVRDW